MTLLLQESFVSSLNTQTNNTYLVATTETGLVVGSSFLNNSQTSLTLWGDESRFYAEMFYNCDSSFINDFDLNEECDVEDYDDDIVKIKLKPKAHH